MSAMLRTFSHLTPGGEGRIRTSNAHRALVLQTNVFTISNRIAVSASVEAVTFLFTTSPGAPAGARTRDTQIKSLVLYLLS